MDLEKIRQEINSCDDAIEQALSKRFELVLEVAKYKKENKIPIFDEQREKKIIEKIQNKPYNNTDEIAEIYQEILRISKKYQSNLLIKNNIILVGFMGSGKSTTGQILAETTGYKFIDLDAKIEKEEKMQIKDIFSSKGEKRFREMETEALKAAVEQEKVIISCGGGIILNEENRQVINKSGTTIFLNGEIKTMMKRVGKGESRPVLKKIFSSKAPEEEYGAFGQILTERMPYYKEVEDIEIIIEGKTPHDIAYEIIQEILQ